MGKPIPGQMCIEAAVCFAYGLPHSDNPPCVGYAVRSMKISLNDSKWSSNTARTAGMRALSVAQLGSDAIDQVAFMKLVAEGLIRRVAPMALRAAASLQPEPHKAKLLAAADRCERDGNAAAADAAAARDGVLMVVADVILQALITLKSPGVQYMYLLDQ